MNQEELKQRLIELLMKCNKEYDVLDCFAAEIIADYLIENNVTIRERGEWVHLGGDEWCCSACGNVINTEGSWEKPTQKFCDECGAEIQGVKYKKNKSWIFASLDEIIDCY